MKKVTMYTKGYCPYCDMAKNLLLEYNVAIDEIDVEKDPAQLKIMLDRSSRRTVPQIFIEDFHVGGYDDLCELDRSGKLNVLLATRGD